MQHNYQRCIIHQEKNIIGFCVSKSCKKSRACCLQCLNEFHNDHTKQIIEQDEVQQLIQKNKNRQEQIFHQIQELESIFKVIKLSYQSLLQITPIDLDNTQLLIDQIEILLKTDNTLLEISIEEFKKTTIQLGKYAQCILNFKMDDYEIKENIEKYNQVKQLIKQVGCSQSLQVFENMLSTQTSTQTTKIYSVITAIFQSLGFIQQKSKVGLDKFQFALNLTPSNITIEQNYKKAIQTMNSSLRMALIQPGMGKTGCIKIKFRIICQNINWIGLGLCKKDIVLKNNYTFVNYDSLGHGYYMISSNSYTWSNLEPSVNHKLLQNFEFRNNDIITLIVDLDKAIITWNHEIKNLQYSMKFQLDDDLFIFSALYYQGESVEIIE